MFNFQGNKTSFRDRNETKWAFVELGNATKQLIKLLTLNQGA